MKPYYQDDYATIYHGDMQEILPMFAKIELLVTDPPYGIDYNSGHFGTLPRSIDGDKDTALRDLAIMAAGEAPMLVFGTWRVERPAATRMVLVWDTGGALGMGALDLPWKPSHQEIYVLGKGFEGRRTSDVLRCPPVQSMAYNGRVHPHEKPVGLMLELLQKCPQGLELIDPFMGSGPTLRAAKDLRMKSYGIEKDEAYCETAANRLAQEVLAL